MHGMGFSSYTILCHLLLLLSSSFVVVDVISWLQMYSVCWQGPIRKPSNQSTVRCPNPPSANIGGCPKPRKTGNFQRLATRTTCPKLNPNHHLGCSRSSIHCYCYFFQGFIPHVKLSCVICWILCRRQNRFRSVIQNFCQWCHKVPVLRPRSTNTGLLAHVFKVQVCFID